MDNFEKVEKLREKANVSYEEAKAALEANNYDMLDAIVYLERMGKVDKTPSAEYVVTSSTTDYSNEFKNSQKDYEKSCKKTFGQGFADFMKMLGRGLKKSLEVNFVVTRKGEQLVALPLLLLIVLSIWLFWIIIPLIIVGLFLDCRYSFNGFSSETDKNINDLCNKVSEGCDDIKNNFKSEN